MQCTLKITLKLANAQFIHMHVTLGEIYIFNMLDKEHKMHLKI